MKDIKNYENLYAITEDGQVWSHRKQRYLTPQKVKNYWQVGLTKDGVRKFYKLHRLIAEAYLPNPDDLPEVNHKDENPDNNKLSNLEWCDKNYNCGYGTRNERIKHNQPHARRVLCVELNQEFESVSEAAR